MSSGFISENEIAELRKKRQEEWAKVRTADQPEGIENERKMIYVSITMNLQRHQKNRMIPDHCLNVSKNRSRRRNWNMKKHTN